MFSSESYSEDVSDPRSLRPLFLSLFGNEREIRKLRDMREEITVDIDNLVAEFGPKMFENFEDSRLMPQATSPRQGTAESSVLSHPVAWLDERIFGEWTTPD